jgi:hypothetical protein
MSDKIKEALIGAGVVVFGFLFIGGGSILMTMAMNPATWR